MAGQDTSCGICNCQDTGAEGDRRHQEEHEKVQEDQEELEAQAKQSASGACHRAQANNKMERYVTELGILFEEIIFQNLILIHLYFHLRFILEDSLRDRYINPLSLKPSKACYTLRKCTEKMPVKTKSSCKTNIRKSNPSSGIPASIHYPPSSIQYSVFSFKFSAASSHLGSQSVEMPGNTYTKTVYMECRNRGPSRRLGRLRLRAITFYSKFVCCQSCN